MKKYKKLFIILIKSIVILFCVLVYFQKYIENKELKKELYSVKYENHSLNIRMQAFIDLAKYKSKEEQIKFSKKYENKVKEKFKKHFKKLRKRLNY